MNLGNCRVFPWCKVTGHGWSTRAGQTRPVPGWITGVRKLYSLGDRNTYSIIQTKPFKVQPTASVGQRKYQIGGCCDGGSKVFPGSRPIHPGRHFKPGWQVGVSLPVIPHLSQPYPTITWDPIPKRGFPGFKGRSEVQTAARRMELAR